MNRYRATLSRVTSSSAFPAVCVFASLLAYSLFLFNKSMPISEGWYIEYARLINEGAVPYKDFAYLFTPAYLFTIALFTQVFGYDVIGLRILGCIVFASIGLVTYAILSRYFSRSSSVVGAIICMLYKQSGVGEIFYDYIYFVDLFSYLAILFLLFAWDRETNNGARAGMRREGFLLLASGLFAMLTFLTKQTTGAMMLIFVFAAIGGRAICERKAITTWMREALWYVAGALLPVIILGLYLIVNGAVQEFLASCFVGAVNAKGGILKEAFGWILSSREGFVSGIPYAALIALGLFSLKATEGARQLPRHASCMLGKRRRLFVMIAATALVPCIALVLYEWETLTHVVCDFYNGSSLNYVFFGLPSIVFVLLVAKAFSSRAKRSQGLTPKSFLLLAMCGGVFAIGWAVGFSGGLAISQVSLGAGICFAALFDASSRSVYAKRATAVLFAVMIWYCSSWIGVKYEEMYNWWGLAEGSVWEQTSSVDVPLLSGIYMSAKDAACYEGVYGAAQDNLDEGDKLFVFPHCPIFYAVTGHYSDTYSKVQWFDVSTERALEDDMSIIADSPPKMMVLCRIPDGVIAAHESAFGGTWTGEMQESLRKLADARYDTVGSYDLGGGFVVDVYILS